MNYKAKVMIITILLILIIGCLDSVISKPYSIKLSSISEGKTFTKYNSINLIINNTKQTRFEYSIPIVGITYSDGNQEGNLMVGSNICTETNTRRYGGWVLLPNTQQELSFCFETIDWSKSPKLYLSINYENAEDEIMIPLQYTSNNLNTTKTFISEQFPVWYDKYINCKSSKFEPEECVDADANGKYIVWEGTVENIKDTEVKVLLSNANLAKLLNVKSASYIFYYKPLYVNKTEIKTIHKGDGIKFSGKIEWDDYHSSFDIIDSNIIDVGQQYTIDYKTRKDETVVIYDSSKDIGDYKNNVGIDTCPKNLPENVACIP